MEGYWRRDTTSIKFFLELITTCIGSKIGFEFIPKRPMGFYYTVLNKSTFLSVEKCG